LVESVRLGPELELDRLWFKLETCNPSGSYKDRFIAAEMQRMLDAGARSCVATSSGNTGSALAAYGARYRVRCAIVVNEHVPSGKLAQMQAHGARVLRVQGFATSPVVTERVFATLGHLSAGSGIPLVVSAYRYCPVGMAGVESLGKELRIQCGNGLEQIFVPVGGGGLFTAVCRGMHGSGARIHAVQPEGCLTVVASYLRGDDELRPVESTTRVSGLAVPFGADGELALAELRRNGGTGIAASDEEIFEAQRLMLEAEGIYTEPAGAAALAGLIHAVQAGAVRRGSRVVCLVTGHGFKDPESIAAAARRHPDLPIDPAKLGEVLEQISSGADQDEH
jgi:threonine synthase